jgi:hypothetical protein
MILVDDFDGNFAVCRFLLAKHNLCVAHHKKY